MRNISKRSCRERWTLVFCMFNFRTFRMVFGTVMKWDGTNVQGLCSAHSEVTYVELQGWSVSNELEVVWEEAFEAVYRTLSGDTKETTKSSDRVADIRDEIWIRDLPGTQAMCCPLKQGFRREFFKFIPFKSSASGCRVATVLAGQIRAVPTQYVTHRQCNSDLWPLQLTGLLLVCTGHKTNLSFLH